ncbi:MAG: isochorismatase family protein [Propionibacteriaceae bacterium]
MNEESRAIHERSGWGRRLAWGARPAIVVVDLMTAFTDDTYALGSDLAAQVEATRALVDATRHARPEVPVVWTTIGYDSNLSDAGLWADKCSGLSDLVRGSRAVSLDSRLQVDPADTIIEKQGASAFFGTNLVSVLVRQGVDTIVLCGASTSGCIRATAVDAMQYGFVCVIPEECVGDRSRVQHESNLFEIDAKYGDVCSAAVAADFLRGVDDDADQVG